MGTNADVPSRVGGCADSRGLFREGFLSGEIAGAQSVGAGWQRRLRGVGATLFVTVLVLGSHVALWSWFNRPVAELPWTGVMRGVSFSPYQTGQSPYANTYPNEQELEADLRRLRGKVETVRTYSSTNGFERVPRLAQRHGLKVMAGAWLDKRKENNADEIVNVVRNARKYPNVSRVIIGNETILRGDLTVQDLSFYLRKVRKRLRQPVSTAEPWHVWLKYPELAKSVDFIAIHVLPYWEGVPADESVDWVIARFKQVQAEFPNKRVVIAEAGWPSDGNRLEDAKPSLTNSARFVRRFLNAATAQKIDYFIMEAYDQAWKRVEEGSVGPHWGLWSADREAKFPMVGDIVADEQWRAKALVASLLVLGPIIWFSGRRRDVRLPGRVFFASLLQMSAAALVWSALLPVAGQLSGIGLITWSLLFPAQGILLAVVLVNGLEMAEMLWQPRMRRRFQPLQIDPGRTCQKVSLHLPIHNEPPEVVIETLDSMARLDYQDYEVLVIDNNTRDQAVWEPVQQHCQRLGHRFRFFHLDDWPGYKAGALNFALRETHSDAAVIGIVDSDYVLEPGWLSALVPYFDHPQVGFVQAPQDHRAWEGSAFKTMCNWEYNGFFEIGMVQRNERNAIIQHGTMTLIRRAALERVGGWGEWCICEDAELGLRLLAAGNESVYVNRVFGRGLIPDTFTAYRNQRFRWVYGAVQILKGHWRELLGRAGKLSAGQRFHFLTGWLPWFADAAHLIFTFAGVLWSIGLLVSPRHFEFPLRDFLVATVGVFLFKLLHNLSLYGARVKCGWRERLGAAIAGMALTHTIAKAIFAGIGTRTRPFLRTPKSESTQAWVQGLTMAREEALIALALLMALAAVLEVFGIGNAEALLWAVVLGAQSVPYLAAVTLAIVGCVPAKTAQAVTPPVPPAATPVYATPAEVIA
ncbi:MAG: glycosyltransferase [Chromatiales bacterium]